MIQCTIVTGIVTSVGNVLFGVPGKCAYEYDILKGINHQITLSFISRSIRLLKTTSAMFAPEWAPLSSMKSSKSDTNTQSFVIQDAVNARNAI